MPAEVWKDRDVAAAFLNERSLLIPDRQRQLEVLLRVLRFAPRPPRRVLDLGAGDAILLATVLEGFPEAEGVALDFSPLMLEQARRRLAPFEEQCRWLREIGFGPVDCFWKYFELALFGGFRQESSGNAG